MNVRRLTETLDNAFDSSWSPGHALQRNKLQIRIEMHKRTNQQDKPNR